MHPLLGTRRVALGLLLVGGLAAFAPSVASAAITDARVEMSKGENADPADLPLIGDWDGDGRQTVGLYRPGTRQFGYKNVNDTSSAAVVGIGGDPGDIPLVGRWNAALTHDEVGLFRPSNGTFYYAPDNSGRLDASLLTGAESGDVPISGDWNGDGIDTFGLWRPSTRTAYGWTSNTTADHPAVAAGIGNPGDLPVIGDWNADGIDTVGLFRGSTTMYNIFYGTDPRGPDADPAGVPFGNPYEKPVAGDFDGDGSDGLGTFNSGTHLFYLSDSNQVPPSAKPPVGKPGPAPTPPPGNGTVDGAPTGDGTVGRLVVPKGKQSLSVTFGRKVRLTGTLQDPQGRPIAGAQVDVFDQLGLAGSPKAKVATVLTDEKGAYTYLPLTTGSRTLEFAYAARAGSGDYSDRLTVKLRVKAGLTFALDRKTAARRRAVRFSGKVLADPLPKKGVRVVIEAKNGKRWLTSALLRVKADGTFKWVHPFRTRGTFSFRARVLSSSELPVSANSSKTRTLKVR